MSQSNSYAKTSNLAFSVFIVGSSLCSVLLFGALIWVLGSSAVNQSGVITQTRTGMALLLMWFGMLILTIGGSLYFSRI